MSQFSPKDLKFSSTTCFPRGFKIRPVELDDAEKGIFEVLGVLTTVGDITKDKWQALFEHWKSHCDIYKVCVIVDVDGKVAACGTILIEHKIIHECGKVGHIEDIAVAKKYQGGPGKIGRRLINALGEIGEGQGCYKIILDCSDHNVGFYEKCGYTKEGNEMVRRVSKL